MAWNEPGSGNRDPWGNRGTQEGPPDLDAVIGKLQEKMRRLFGGRGGRGGRGGAGPAAGESPKGGFGWIIAAIVGVWLAYDMVYLIQPAERGVVLRFGEYTDTLQPGPNVRLPRPIEKVVRIDVDQIRNAEIGYRSEGGKDMGGIEGESLMLTQDENIVDIKVAVQYKVKSAQDYLFNLTDPDLTLREVTESALREIVGKGKMDFVLTEGRREISERAFELIQAALDRYNAGLILTSVNLQDAQPPEQVQHAFADAVKAREDEQRLKNEAEAYSNDIIPKARGAAARRLEEANAYKSQVIAEAEGEASRFNQVLKEYEKAPQVTRERLFIDAMESVLSNTSKILVSVKQGNNVLYLPLERFVQQQGGDVATMSAKLTAAEAASGGASTQVKPDDAARDVRARDNLRGREVR